MEKPSGHVWKKKKQGQKRSEWRKEDEMGFSGADAVYRSVHRSIRVCITNNLSKCFRLNIFHTNNTLLLWFFSHRRFMYLAIIK